MEIEFEIGLLVILALIFMVTYLQSEDLKQKVVLGSLDIICWFALSLVFVATKPAYPTISYLFMAIGIIFTVFLFTGLFDMWRKRDKVWR